MISILSSGSLITAPVGRTSKNGNAFVTAQMKADDGTESALVSLIAFDEDVCKSLMALSRGDAVVVSGPGKPSTWQNRQGEAVLGLNVVVKVILTHYALTKRRKASAEVAYGLPAQSPLQQPADEDGTAPF